MKNFKIASGIVLILFVLGISGLFLYRDFTSVKNTENQINSNPNIVKTEEKSAATSKSTKEDSAKNGSIQSTRDSLKEKQAEIASIKNISQKIPDLPKQTVVKRELPEEIKSKTIDQIKILSETLRKDSNYLEGWIELGLLRKLLADYEGARDAWEYAAFLSPTFHVPFHNLGFLYLQHLKDFRKSEENYLKAIDNEPKDIQAYIDLSDLYYFSLNDANNAKEILNKGIKANSNDLALPRAISDLEERINKSKS